MTRLQHRTEGWVAGLQLLALSLRGRDDTAELIDSFSGSRRYVLDYLMEEVFGRQPPEVQEFLLQTSVLERMNGPPCDAIAATPPGRSQSMLDALERSDLFVVPLDAARLVLGRRDGAAALAASVGERATAAGWRHLATQATAVAALAAPSAE